MCISLNISIYKFMAFSRSCSAASGQVMASGSGSKMQRHARGNEAHHCQMMGPSGCLVSGVSNGEEATAASDASGNYNGR